MNRLVIGMQKFKDKSTWDLDFELHHGVDDDLLTNIDDDLSFSCFHNFTDSMSDHLYDTIKENV
jgi:hypothetical protein